MVFVQVFVTVSFAQLLYCADKRIVNNYTHCQYNESVHGKEEQATWINTIP